MARSFSKKLSNSRQVQKNGSKTWTVQLLDMLETQAASVRALLTAHHTVVLALT